MNNQCECLSRPKTQARQHSGCWVPEREPEFIQFESALDEFSQATLSKRWHEVMNSISSARGPWTSEQTALLTTALKRAPKALMKAPYSTLTSLMKINKFAAQQGKLPEAFWAPLDEAFCELHLDQLNEKK